MPTYKIHQAKTHLSRLIAQVETGAEVVIARNGEPVARLIPYRRRGVRRFGALSGRVKLDASFFDPLPEAELAAWED